MSAHTPGPWTTRGAQRGPDADIGIVAPGCAGVIAECFEEFRGRGVRTPMEAEANARLIAAAPELLEVARAAVLELTTVGIGHGHTHSVDVVRQLQRAIAKAEGRS
ncbi:MAG: hypothetical protein ACM33U_08635 [Solirubrobacterales bacterium]